MAQTQKKEDGSSLPVIVPVDDTENRSSGDAEDTHREEDRDTYSSSSRAKDCFELLDLLLSPKLSDDRQKDSDKDDLRHTDEGYKS